MYYFNHYKALIWMFWNGSWARKYLIRVRIYNRLLLRAVLTAQRLLRGRLGRAFYLLYRRTHYALIIQKRSRIFLAANRIWHRIRCVALTDCGALHTLRATTYTTRHYLRYTYSLRATLYVLRYISRHTTNATLFQRFTLHDTLHVHYYTLRSVLLLSFNTTLRTPHYTLRSACASSCMLHYTLHFTMTPHFLSTTQLWRHFELSYVVLALFSKPWNPPLTRIFLN